MTRIGEEPEGATPLDPSDQEELIPTWIATREDLNVAEQENVASAMVWALGRKWLIDDMDQGLLKELHRRMFCDVWRWAGSYRKSDTNIGASWPEIPASVENLVRDLKEQTAGPSLAWPADEVAIRFHHRLASIHPFPNGNGRHARLAADLVVVALGGSRFGWGAGSQLSGRGPGRDEYLRALRTADATGDHSALLAFARDRSPG